MGINRIRSVRSFTFHYLLFRVAIIGERKTNNIYFIRGGATWFLRALSLYGLIFKIIITLIIMPEVHFIGEAIGGAGFGRFAQFCKFKFAFGNGKDNSDMKGWSLLSGQGDGQTQVSMPNRTDTSSDQAVWSHPIDAHYLAGDVSNWPKLFVEVWREDSYGRWIIAGYGSCWIPPSAGEKSITIPTWVPEGDGWQSLTTKFLGSTPQLENPEMVYASNMDKYNFVTRTSGTVTFRLNTVGKGFAEAGIDLG